MHNRKMAKPKKEKGPPGVDAFIDLGYKPGLDFCKHFLLSPEFTLKSLRLLADSKSKDRLDLAESLATEAAKDEDVCNEILLSYVSRARTWLAFKFGSEFDLFDGLDAKQHLAEFGDDDWYGPIEGEDATYYLRPFAVWDWTVMGSGAAAQLGKRRVRWVIAAKIQGDCLSLSWKGITLGLERFSTVRLQYPFWREVKIAFKEIQEHLGGKWRRPPLDKLVLTHLWNKYETAPGFKWQHLAIRAEQAGVALNARSTGVQELNTKGLKALTAELTKAACQAAGVNAPAARRRIESAILATLMREWGTRSYEFSLAALTENGEEPIFRAHSYFGMKQGGTQDSLQHLRCYGPYGASTSTLRFLLQELAELQSTEAAEATADDEAADDDEDSSDDE